MPHIPSKKERANVALSAANMGRLTKLKEHVVEAVGVPKQEDNDDSDRRKRSMNALVLARSSFFQVVHEAAAMGKMKGLKPVITTSVKDTPRGKRISRQRMNNAPGNSGSNNKDNNNKGGNSQHDSVGSFSQRSYDVEGTGEGEGQDEEPKTISPNTLKIQESKKILIERIIRAQREEKLNELQNPEYHLDRMEKWQKMLTIEVNAETGNATASMAVPSPIIPSFKLPERSKSSPVSAASTNPSSSTKQTKAATMLKESKTSKASYCRFIKEENDEEESDANNVNMHDVVAKEAAFQSCERTLRIIQRGELKVTQGCSCVYCQNPNPFQTSQYQQLLKKKLNKGKKTATTIKEGQNDGDGNDDDEIDKTTANAMSFFAPDAAVTATVLHNKKNSPNRTSKKSIPKTTIDDSTGKTTIQQSPKKPTKRSSLTKGIDKNSSNSLGDPALMSPEATKRRLKVPTSASSTGARGSTTASAKRKKRAFVPKSPAAGWKQKDKLEALLLAGPNSNVTVRHGKKRRSSASSKGDKSTVSSAHPSTDDDDEQSAMGVESIGDPSTLFNKDKNNDEDGSSGVSTNFSYWESVVELTDDDTTATGKRGRGTNPNWSDVSSESTEYEVELIDDEEFDDNFDFDDDDDDDDNEDDENIVLEMLGGSRSTNLDGSSGIAGLEMLWADSGQSWQSSMGSPVPTDQATTKKKKKKTIQSPSPKKKQRRKQQQGQDQEHELEQHQSEQSKEQLGTNSSRIPSPPPLSSPLKSPPSSKSKSRKKSGTNAATGGGGASSSSLLSSSSGKPQNLPSSSPLQPVAKRSTSNGSKGTKTTKTKTKKAAKRSSTTSLSKKNKNKKDDDDATNMTLSEDESLDTSSRLTIGTHSSTNPSSNPIQTQQEDELGVSIADITKMEYSKSDMHHNVINDNSSTIIDHQPLKDAATTPIKRRRRVNSIGGDASISISSSSPGGGDKTTTSTKSSSSSGGGWSSSVSGRDSKDELVDENLESEELDELLYKQSNGLIIDENRLYELQLYEWNRQGKNLTLDQMEDLNRFVSNKRRHEVHTREFNKLLDQQEQGEDVDEDRLYNLELAIRHRLGESLTVEELQDLEAFEFLEEDKAAERRKKKKKRKSKVVEGEEDGQQQEKRSEPEGGNEGQVQEHEQEQEQVGQSKPLVVEEEVPVPTPAPTPAPTAASPAPATTKKSKLDFSKIADTSERTRSAHGRLGIDSNFNTDHESIISSFSHGMVLHSSIQEEDDDDNDDVRSWSGENHYFQRSGEEQKQGQRNNRRKHRRRRKVSKTTTNNNVRKKMKRRIKKPKDNTTTSNNDDEFLRQVEENAKVLAEQRKVREKKMVKKKKRPSTMNTKEEEKEIHEDHKEDGEEQVKRVSALSGSVAAASTTTKQKKKKNNNQEGDDDDDDEFLRQVEEGGQKLSKKTTDGTVGKKKKKGEQTTSKDGGGGRGTSKRKLKHEQSSSSNGTKTSSNKDDSSKRSQRSKMGPGRQSPTTSSSATTPSPTPIQQQQQQLQQQVYNVSGEDFNNVSNGQFVVSQQGPHAMQTGTNDDGDVFGLNNNKNSGDEDKGKAVQEALLALSNILSGLGTNIVQTTDRQSPVSGITPKATSSSNVAFDPFGMPIEPDGDTKAATTTAFDAMDAFGTPFSPDIPAKGIAAIPILSTATTNATPAVVAAVPNSAIDFPTGDGWNIPETTKVTHTSSVTPMTIDDCWQNTIDTEKNHDGFGRTSSTLNEPTTDWGVVERGQDDFFGVPFSGMEKNVETRNIDDPIMDVSSKNETVTRTTTATTTKDPFGDPFLPEEEKFSGDDVHVESSFYEDPFGLDGDNYVRKSERGDTFSENAFDDPFSTIDDDDDDWKVTSTFDAGTNDNPRTAAAVAATTAISASPPMTGAGQGGTVAADFESAFGVPFNGENITDTSQPPATTSTAATSQRRTTATDFENAFGMPFNAANTETSQFTDPFATDGQAAGVDHETTFVVPFNTSNTEMPQTTTNAAIAAAASAATTTPNQSGTVTVDQESAFGEPFFDAGPIFTDVFETTGKREITNKQAQSDAKSSSASETIESKSLAADAKISTNTNNSVVRNDEINDKAIAPAPPGSPSSATGMPELEDTSETEQDSVSISSAGVSFSSIDDSSRNSLSNSKNNNSINNIIGNSVNNIRSIMKNTNASNSNINYDVKTANGASNQPRKDANTGIDNSSTGTVSSSDYSMQAQRFSVLSRLGASDDEVIPEMSTDSKLIVNDDSDEESKDSISAKDKAGDDSDDVESFAGSSGDLSDEFASKRFMMTDDESYPHIPVEGSDLVKFSRTRSTGEKLERLELDSDAEENKVTEENTANETFSGNNNNKEEILKGVTNFLDTNPYIRDSDQRLIRSYLASLQGEKPVVPDDDGDACEEEAVAENPPQIEETDDGAIENHSEDEGSEDDEADLSLSSGEIDELTELLNLQDCGDECDEQRLYDLDVYDKWRNGEDLTEKERKDLSGIKTRRRRERRYRTEYQELLDKRDSGEEVNEDRFRFLQLYARRRVGEALTDEELKYLQSYENRGKVPVPGSINVEKAMTPQEGPSSADFDASTEVEGNDSSGPSAVESTTPELEVAPEETPTDQKDFHSDSVDVDTQEEENVEENESSIHCENDIPIEHDVSGGSVSGEFRESPTEPTTASSAWVANPFEATFVQTVPESSTNENAMIVDDVSTLHSSSSKGSLRADTANEQWMETSLPFSATIMDTAEVTVAETDPASTTNKGAEIASDVFPTFDETTLQTDSTKGFMVEAVVSAPPTCDPTEPPASPSSQTGREAAIQEKELMLDDFPTSHSPLDEVDSETNAVKDISMATTMPSSASVLDPTSLPVTLSDHGTTTNKDKVGTSDDFADFAEATSNFDTASTMKHVMHCSVPIIDQPIGPPLTQTAADMAAQENDSSHSSDSQVTPEADAVSEPLTEIAVLSSPAADSTDRPTAQTGHDITMSGIEVALDSSPSSHSSSSEVRPQADAVPDRTIDADVPFSGTVVGFTVPPVKQSVPDIATDENELRLDQYPNWQIDTVTEPPREVSVPSSNIDDPTWLLQPGPEMATGKNETILDHFAGSHSSSDEEKPQSDTIPATSSTPNIMDPTEVEMTQTVQETSVPKGGANWDNFPIFHSSFDVTTQGDTTMERSIEVENPVVEDQFAASHSSVADTNYQIDTVNEPSSEIVAPTSAIIEPVEPVVTQTAQETAANQNEVVFDAFPSFGNSSGDVISDVADVKEETVEGVASPSDAMVASIGPGATQTSIGISTNTLEDTSEDMHTSHSSLHQMNAKVDTMPAAATQVATHASPVDDPTNPSTTQTGRDIPTHENAVALDDSSDPQSSAEEVSPHANTVAQLPIEEAVLPALSIMEPAMPVAAQIGTETDTDENFIFFHGFPTATSTFDEETSHVDTVHWPSGEAAVPSSPSMMDPTEPAVTNTDLETTTHKNGDFFDDFFPPFHSSLDGMSSKIDTVKDISKSADTSLSPYVNHAGWTVTQAGTEAKSDFGFDDFRTFQPSLDEAAAQADTAKVLPKGGAARSSPIFDPIESTADKIEAEAVLHEKEENLEDFSTSHSSSDDVSSQVDTVEESAVASTAFFDSAALGITNAQSSVRTTAPQNATVLDDFPTLSQSDLSRQQIDDSTMSSAEIDELDKLLDLRESGKEHDENRLHELDVYDRWRDGEDLDEIEKDVLALFKAKRTRERGYRREFQELIEKRDNGQEFDGDRMHFLQLYARAHIGEALSTVEVEFLEKYELSEEAEAAAAEESENALSCPGERIFVIKPEDEQALADVKDRRNEDWSKEAAPSWNTGFGAKPADEEQAVEEVADAGSNLGLRSRDWSKEESTPSWSSDFDTRSQADVEATPKDAPSRNKPSNIEWNGGMEDTWFAGGWKPLDAAEKEAWQEEDVESDSEEGGSSHNDRDLDIAVVDDRPGQGSEIGPGKVSGPTETTHVPEDAGGKQLEETVHDAESEEERESPAEDDEECNGLKGDVVFPEGGLANHESGGVQHARATEEVRGHENVEGEGHSGEPHTLEMKGESLEAKSAERQIAVPSDAWWQRAGAGNEASVDIDGGFGYKFGEEDKGERLADERARREAEDEVKRLADEVKLLAEDVQKEELRQEEEKISEGDRARREAELEVKRLAEEVKLLAEDVAKEERRQEDEKVAEETRCSTQFDLKVQSDGKAESEGQSLQLKEPLYGDIERGMRLQEEARARREAEDEVKRLAEEVKKERVRQEQETQRLEAEIARQVAEAKERQLAERAQQARRRLEEEARRLKEEKARMEAEEEIKRLAGEVEKERLRQAEEKRRLEEEKACQDLERKRLEEEKARREAEAEVKRLAEEVERHRREAEAEVKRLAEEVERERLRQEDDKKRLEAGIASQEAEAEERRRAEEAEREHRRLEETAKRLKEEKARMEAEEEIRRLTEEVEKERLRQAEEKKRLEEEKNRLEAERTRLEVEGEVKRLADEVKKERLRQEEEKERLEAEIASQEAEAKERRLAEEAERERRRLEETAKRLKEEKARMEAEEEIRRLTEEVEKERLRQAEEKKRLEEEKARQEEGRSHLEEEKARLETEKETRGLDEVIERGIIRQEGDEQRSEEEGSQPEAEEEMKKLSDAVEKERHRLEERKKRFEEDRARREAEEEVKRVSQEAEKDRLREIEEERRLEKDRARQEAEDELKQLADDIQKERLQLQEERRKLAEERDRMEADARAKNRSVVETQILPTLAEPIDAEIPETTIVVKAQDGSSAEFGSEIGHDADRNAARNVQNKKLQQDVDSQPSSVQNDCRGAEVQPLLCREEGAGLNVGVPEEHAAGEVTEGKTEICAIDGSEIGSGAKSDDDMAGQETLDRSLDYTCGKNCPPGMPGQYEDPSKETKEEVEPPQQSIPLQQQENLETNAEHGEGEEIIARLSLVDSEADRKAAETVRESLDIGGGKLLKRSASRQNSNSKRRGSHGRSSQSSKSEARSARLDSSRNVRGNVADRLISAEVARIWEEEEGSQRSSEESKSQEPPRLGSGCSQGSRTDATGGTESRSLFSKVEGIALTVSGQLPQVATNSQPTDLGSGKRVLAGAHKAAQSNERMDSLVREQIDLINKYHYEETLEVGTPVNAQVQSECSNSILSYAEISRDCALDVWSKSSRIDDKESLMEESWKYAATGEANEVNGTPNPQSPERYNSDEQGQGVEPANLATSGDSPIPAEIVSKRPRRKSTKREKEKIRHPVSWNSDPVSSFSDWRVEVHRDGSQQVDTYNVHRNIVGFGPRKSGLLYQDFLNASSEQTETAPPEGTNITRLNLQDRQAELVPTVLDFVYYLEDASPTLSAERACNIFKVAEQLQIKGLQTTIAIFYRKNLCLRNMGAFLHCAARFDAARLVRVAKLRIGSIMKEHPEHAVLLRPKFFRGLIKIYWEELDSGITLRVQRGKMGGSARERSSVITSHSKDFSRGMFLCLSRNRKKLSRQQFHRLTNEDVLPAVDATAAYGLMTMEIKLENDGDDKKSSSHEGTTNLQKRCAAAIANDWHRFASTFPSPDEAAVALQQLPPAILVDILLRSSTKQTVMEEADGEQKA